MLGNRIVHYVLFRRVVQELFAVSDSLLNSHQPAPDVQVQAQVPPVQRDRLLPTEAPRRRRRPCRSWGNFWFKSFWAKCCLRRLRLRRGGGGVHVRA